MTISGTCITCHATYNAEDRAQAIVCSIDGVTQPAAAAFMPAFAAHHHIQHTLRPNRTDHLTHHAPMALFLAPYLAQHRLSLGVVDVARLGLVAGYIFIFLALKLAQRCFGTKLPAQPTLQAHLHTSLFFWRFCAQLCQ